MSANPLVFEFGMGVDVHGGDGTKAACRAVSDAIRRSRAGLQFHLTKFAGLAELA